ncbi:uncharacterized protein [Elaeis guineensis]|uniref:Uncharacterized protein LOC105053772 n=1 Tax=Elaeis guineensis var. tenera TaxID=51953 RepID=A0A6I9RVP3_ELAGV|nr:uncharacterized protein LOC105053772 [Elaeis guineensis]
MEPLRSLMDKIKGFAKAGEGVLKGAFRKSSESPVEMLKHVQREAFSDLVKLRDGQEKVETMLSVYKFATGFPFLEAKTPIKGFIDVVGIMLLAGDDFQQACGALDRAGTRTGIDSKFTFEIGLRQKDALIAEIATSQKCWVHDCERSEIPLTLSALMYVANINDWLSVISVPLGARCSNFGIGSNILKGRRRGGISSFGPPVFSQCHSFAAGLIFKRSDVEACLAELVSGQGMQHSADGNGTCLSTFAQVSYQPLEKTKISLSGLWQMSRLPCPLIKLGPFAIPVGSSKQQTGSDIQMQAPPNATTRNTVDFISSGSIALMLDSEFDERTRLGGWIEVQKSSHNFFQWGISLSDTPDDELGYGLRVGGIAKGHLVDQFQLEGFLNYNLGRSLNLQPGLVWVMEGMTRSAALVFRTSWFM